MTELNSHSLEEAMIACYTKYDYKVGVIFPSFKRMHDFAQAMHQQSGDGLVPAIHYGGGIDKIYFDTGSSIHMIEASDDWNLVGWSFNRVLYDPAIKDKTTLTLIRECEREPSLYFMDKRNVRSAKEIEVDPQPLDEFLSGFSITKT